MKVTTEELERCEVLLTIELEPARVQDLMKKAAQRIAREVKIPGFRPGKAPYNVVVRRFGVEAIQREVLESSVEKIITDALAEVELTPYAQIQLDEVEWEPLLIKVRVPTQPKVELGSYHDIRLEATPVEVTDEDVDQTLKQLQEQSATWTPVERPAAAGDLISMAVTEKDGDEVLAEHESVEYELTLPAETDSQQPDLTTPLLGLSAGESKTFTLTYPEDFDNQRYAGKEITFTVEVSGVKAKELDALDDEFAQQVGEFDTLEALKEQIRTNLRQQGQNQADADLGVAALEKVIEGAEKVEWPLALEEEQIDHEVEHYEYHLKQAGLTLDGYLKMQNKTKDELREETRDKVADQIKRGLVMGKIAELEKLAVSQVEILQQAKLIADLSGGGDQVWSNILASESRQNLIANDLLSNKVIQRLAAIAKGEAQAEAETAGDTVPAVVSEEGPAGSATEPQAEAPVTETASPAPETLANQSEAETEEAASEASPAPVDEDKPESESTEETITAKA